LTRLRKVSIAGSQITLGGVVQLFTSEQKRPLTEALVALDAAVVDEIGNVIAINVAGTSFGDAEMKQLQDVATLKELHLTATSVTDAGMAQLTRLTNLERLFIAKCPVSDAGLAHVKGLTHLQVLNV